MDYYQRLDLVNRRENVYVYEQYSTSNADLHYQTWGHGSSGEHELVFHDNLQSISSQIPLST